MVNFKFEFMFLEDNVRCNPYAARHLASLANLHFDRQVGLHAIKVRIALEPLIQGLSLLQPTLKFRKMYYRAAGPYISTLCPTVNRGPDPITIPKVV